METAVGAASWLVGKVLNKLSDDLVAAYVASSELGLNAEQIKADLMYTQGLLHAAQGRDDNPGLKGLLEQLSEKADEAEDALDELHYFMIQDKLDGTQHAAPDLGGDIQEKVQHGRNAARHTIDHSSTTSTAADLKRPLVGSTSVEDKLYGRSAIFEQTIEDITGGAYHGQTLSVLPIVGPGGIGKTTFTQHLYNDKKTEEHFAVRVWVCVSTDFDVLKLTQQIHNCIPALKEEEGNSIASGTTNLDQLQIAIAHRLKSKRFLIVLDDIWKCDSDDEWKTLLSPFMKGEANGSMVLVTTRFPKIEERVKKATVPIKLQGLDPNEFWEFFQACVFGENIPDHRYNELIDIGKEIAEKLKCSPLAAKTVARLLRKHLSWEHWRKVLENNEWKNQTNSDDIMPALKISYDYLPFYLKQCFSYFCLFPEDHKFKSLEITHFWTAIGIIDTSSKNRNYLEELVDNGFLMKETGDDSGDQCYVMHDLLHELSRSVSSQECLNISSFSFSADDIPQSIRHVSITIEGRYDENFRKEMAKLKSRINIGNLRTLMVFRNYENKIVEILANTFKEVEALRVLFIVMKSLESLPKTFSKLLHLRYLRIISSYGLEMILPSALSILYHLIVLDLEHWMGSRNLPEYISRLVNLRHFIAWHDMHSNVPEVGKLEHLQELKRFHVRKRSVGFELEELGKLRDIGGELTVINLQKVATKEEATKANLALKKNLKKLELYWGTGQSGVQQVVNLNCDVFDGLQPHDNLKELAIVNDGGAVGPPSWLCRDIPITHLESLTLNNVSWGILPPFGELPYLKILELRSIDGVRLIGPDPGTGRNQGFMQLKKVVLMYMPDLENWIVEPNCQLFPMLEIIECKGCPNLLALPFLPECSVSCTQDVHCPSLRILHIFQCPKMYLPPMPPAPALTSIKVADHTREMLLEENCFGVEGYGDALAFHNMENIVHLQSHNASVTSWTDLQKATSLRVLSISKDSRMKSLACISSLRSLTNLSLEYCGNIRVDGSNPLIALVNLKKLTVLHCGENYPCSVVVDLLSEVARSKVLPPGSFQLETLCVDSISAVLVAPICNLLADSLMVLMFSYDQRVESLTEDEEKAFQLLTSLRELRFKKFPGLPSLPQGLHSLSSLKKIFVVSCPEIRSLPKGGLPSSLHEIYVVSCSDELEEQVKQLEGTNPTLQVKLRFDMRRSVVQLKVPYIYFYE
ncbi:unnamed protein product [Alopecurus aequalis]